ncbi:MAG: FAD:protein FMN transferase [bacterium]
MERKQQYCGNLGFRILVMILLCVQFLVTGCKSEETFSGERRLLGTHVQVKVVSKNKVQAQAAIEAAFKEIERVEKLASGFIADNELSRLNDKGVSNNEELFLIIDKALAVSRLTGGAFDISVLPLVELWGFKSGEHRVPDDEEIIETLAGVGYQGIKLDYEQHKVYLNNRRVDLSGVAKGYAIDMAIKLLRARGIKKALVNAGGDIRFIGERTWNIGIRHPRIQDELVKNLSLKDRAIVTSGDYEKFFEENKKRYSHIINPLTGYPADECASVTVIGRDATTSDALATGVFVMGIKRGMELIENLEGMDGVIIGADGSIYVSKVIKNQKGGYQ